jgi:hypothetical protein
MCENTDRNSFTSLSRETYGFHNADSNETHNHSINFCRHLPYRILIKSDENVQKRTQFHLSLQSTTCDAHISTKHTATHCIARTPHKPNFSQNTEGVGTDSLFEPIFITHTPARKFSCRAPLPEWVSIRQTV